MIKKQILGILIAMVSLVGCVKPKVKVLSGKEGANYILTIDPKDAKISFLRKLGIKMENKSWKM